MAIDDLVEYLRLMLSGENLMYLCTNWAVSTEYVFGEGLGERWNDSWEGSGGRVKFSVEQERVMRNCGNRNILHN